MRKAQSGISGRVSTLTVTDSESIPKLLLLGYRADVSVFSRTNLSERVYSTSFRPTLFGRRTCLWFTSDCQADQFH